jgi:hypothetical protein
MEVIISGMLESLVYIRQHGLVADPNDRDLKHDGRNGGAKLRIVPRKQPRD